MKKILFIFTATSLFLIGAASTMSVYANWTVPVVSQFNKNKFTGGITNYHTIRSISVPAANYKVSDYDSAAGGGWNYTTYNEYTYYKNTSSGRIYGP